MDSALTTVGLRWFALLLGTLVAAPLLGTLLHARRGGRYTAGAICSRRLFSSTPIVLNFSSLPADVGDAGLPLSGWQYMAADVNSTASLSPAAAVVGSTFNGTTNATGGYFVWIGATVSASAGVAPGNYTSATPITLDVVYQ